MVSAKTMGYTGIEYGERSFNTIIGCRHNCPWDCWARDVATTRHASKYGEDFGDIQFFPDRLEQPMHTKKPQRVLVNFMGDMWGDWVFTDWIARTLNACEKAPWHDYLFLTKNPKRYGDFMQEAPFGFEIVRTNARPWLGTSVESVEKMGRLDDLINATENAHVLRWVSLEPLLGNPIDKSLESKLFHMDWIVIGALTGKQPKQPEKEWVEWLVQLCKDYNIPYFLKDNLKFEALGIKKVQQYPNGFKKIVE